MLSDTLIRRCIDNGTIGIDPFDVENVQPCSVDLCLSRYFRLLRSHGEVAIDPKRDTTGMFELVEKEKEFILHPHEFVLASTVEQVSFTPSVAGRLDGKSSLGRLGLVIHSTAGSCPWLAYFDPRAES